MSAGLCRRCLADLSKVASTMSRFNTEMLCLKCIEDERESPNYKKAHDAELAQVQQGNYNFPGIGLGPEDVSFLSARRAARPRRRPNSGLFFLNESQMGARKSLQPNWCQRCRMLKEIKTVVLPSRVTLKGVKNAGGEETPRFEASLYLDGKRVANVSNGGTGGCCSWYWHDRKAEAICQPIADDYYRACNPGDRLCESLDSLVYAIMDAADHLKIGKANAKCGFPITVRHRVPRGLALTGYRDRQTMMGNLSKVGSTAYEVVYEVAPNEASALLLEAERKRNAKKGFHVLYEVTRADGATTLLGASRVFSEEQIHHHCAKHGFKSMVVV